MAPRELEHDPPIAADRFDDLTHAERSVAAARDLLGDLGKIKVQVRRGGSAKP